MVTKERRNQAYLEGMKAWANRHVYGNPYDSVKHPELHDEWNAGRDEARRRSERPPVKEEPIIPAKTAADLLMEHFRDKSKLN